MKARYLIALGLVGGAVYLIERAPASSADPVQPRTAEAVVARRPERALETRAPIRAAEAPRLAVVDVTGPAAPDRDGDDDDEGLDEEHGAVQGVLTDRNTGELLAGVTVVVSSPALASPRTAFTDERGSYQLGALPAGEYVVTFHYLEVTIERHGVDVSAMKTTPLHQQMVPAATPRITIDDEYTRVIPIPGRTFESVLAASDCGTREVVDDESRDPDDSLGVSFSGATIDGD